MTLVRANWEPISKRYLQQAEGAKDPALASSLYGSVAEFHLKYRPADGEGRDLPAPQPGAGSAQPAVGQPLRARAAREGQQRRAADARTWQRADRAANREERALAEVAAGELCDKMNRAVDAYTHYRKALDANPIEPRALRAVRDVLARQQGVGGAGQGAGGRRAQQARRARRRPAARPGDADLEAPEPARHGGGVLPPRAQAGRVEPRDGRVLSRVLHREERAAAAADGPRAGAEDRRRRRAPGRDGDGDGARRGEAPAARREGDRDLEGDPAPQAAPARGGDVAARPLHQDREVERAARAPEGRSGRGAGRRRRRKDQSLPRRSSGSIEIA